MPPKKEETFRLEEEGIECKVQKGGLVTVGIGPGGMRLTVFKRKDESPQQAARRKLTEAGSSDTQPHTVAKSSSETDAAQILEPSTQSMDVDDDDESARCPRPGSPAPFNLDETTCELCNGTDDSPVFDLSSGGFCCGACFASGDFEEKIRDAALEQLESRHKAAATQPTPAMPPLQPRRSSRPSKPVVRLYDLDRSGPGQPGWSEYELARLDSRHGRTRDETYAELQAARDKLREEVEVARSENGQLAATLDRIFGRLRELTMPDDEIGYADCQMAAAVMLREAIAEMTQEFERRSEAEAPPVTAEPPAETSTESDTNARPTAAPPEPWTADGHVRMGGVDGAAGQLSIGEAYLSWLPCHCSDEPAQHVPLSDVLFAAIDDYDEVRRSAHGLMAYCC
jgi:hypothetical protein